MTEKRSVMILEDDADLAEGIELSLQSDELRFTICHTIADAKESLRLRRFDLLILDINLPDGSGLDFCRELKQRSNVPIALLTAKDMEMDIVRGLESGADDYITKPFSLMVLRARVRARLRNMQGARPMENGQEQSIQIGPFSFAFDKMEYRKNGENLVLSRTEQKLLRILVENRGTAVSRERLMDRIWTDGAAYVEENALSVTVKRLRDKLGAAGYIRTVYGIGYMWKKEG
mgnify:CR=1 FL=1